MPPFALFALFAGTLVLGSAYAALRTMGASSARSGTKKGTSMGPIKDNTGDPMNRPPKLTETPEQWSARLGVPLDYTWALILVESSGKTGTSLGPIIRLEVHHLIRRVADAVQAGKAPPEALAAIKAHFRINGPKVWQGHQWRPSTSAAWRDSHLPVKVASMWDANQQNEYGAFRLAWSLLTPYNLEDIPFRSMSWGVGQVMGKHFYTLGYRSAEEMFNDATNAAVQTQQMLAFIERDPENKKILPHLRAGHWPQVAEGYNGAAVGTEQNNYYKAQFIKALPKARELAARGSSAMV